MTPKNTRLAAALVAVGLLLCSTPAHADPITAIALIAQGVAVAGGVTVAGFAITAAMATYVAIGASIIGGVMARRRAARAAAAASGGRERLQERTLVMQSSEPSPQIIYGRCSVGGAVIDRMSSSKTYAADDGATKTRPDALQHIVIALACHEITNVHRVFMLGEWLDFDAATGWTTTANFKSTNAAHVTKPVTFSAGGVGTVPGVPAGATVALLSICSDAAAASGDQGAQTHTGATVSGSTISGGPASGTWLVSYSLSSPVSRVRLEWMPGTTTQAASAYLIAAAPLRWTSNHRLLGTAYAVLTLDLDDSRFQGGLPSDLAFEVSGKPLLDPRTSTTAYSDNTALAVYDWLRAPWGFGLTAADIDTASVAAAANACDVLYGAEKFSRVAGAFKAGDDKAAVLADLAENMGGFYAQGPVWSVHAGAWAAPVMSITDDDMVAPTQCPRTATDHDEAFNSARATVLPFGKTSTEDVDPYVNSVFVAADGRAEWQAFTLPFCPSKTQARNLLRQFVEQSRAGMIVQYTGKMRLWRLQVGDRITLTDSIHQITSKTFRVLDWGWAPGQPVTLTLQEDIAATYDAADAADADPAPNTSLPPPGTVDVPASFTAASGNATMMRLGDGSIIPRVLVTWTRPTGIYMTSPGARTEVEWRHVGDSAWQSMRVVGGVESAMLDGVHDLDVVIIRVRHVNSYAVSSAWLSISHYVAGKSAAPTAPTALTVTESASAQRIYTLTHTQDIDHAAYLVRYSPTLTATFDQMTLVAAYWSGAGKTGESTVPADGQWRFAAVAIDSSGNQSAPVYLTVTLSGLAALTAGSGGGNQLFNSDFSLSWRGWTSASSGLSGIREMDKPGWTIATVTPISGNTASIGQGVPVGNPNAYCEEFSSQIPITPLKWYCASAYTGAHRCRTAVFAYFLDATGAVVGNSYGAAATCENNSASSGGQDLAGYKRIYGTGQAPATARTAMLVLRKYDTAAGQANSYLFACRAMFEEVAAATSTPGAWSPGPIGYSGDLDATKGAPAGTYVGTQLAEQLVATVQDINADNKWVPFEKAALIVDWAEINGSIGPIVAQANVFGIVTERDAFTAATDALAAYLVSLSPPWNDTTTTTTIVRATADAKWAEAYNTRATLLAKSSDEAGKRAAWASVSDRPAEQSNLCWNGAGPTLAGWAAGVTIDDFGPGGYWATSMGLTGSRYAITFKQRDSLFGDRIAVRVGDVFSFSADCVHTGAVTGGYDTGIGFFLYDSTGAVVALPQAAKLLKTQVSGSLAGTITIPAGVATAQIWVQVDGFSNFATVGNGAHYTNIIVRRAADRISLVQSAAPELVLASGNFTEANGVNSGSIFGTGNISYQIQNGDQIKVTARISNADCKSLDDYVNLFLDVYWRYDGQSSAGGQSTYIYEKFNIVPSATTYYQIRNSIQRISLIAPLPVNSGSQRSRTVLISASLSTYGDVASGAVWNVFFRGQVEITIEVIKKWG